MRLPIISYLDTDLVPLTHPLMDILSTYCIVILWVFESLLLLCWNISLFFCNGNMATFKKWAHNLCMVTYKIMSFIYSLCGSFYTNYFWHLSIDISFTFIFSMYLLCFFILFFLIVLIYDTTKGVEANVTELGFTYNK